MSPLNLPSPSIVWFAQRERERKELSTCYLSKAGESANTSPYCIILPYQKTFVREQLLCSSLPFSAPFHGLDATSLALCGDDDENLSELCRPHCFSKSWPTLFIGSAGSQADPERCRRERRPLCCSRDPSGGFWPLVERRRSFEGQQWLYAEYPLLWDAQLIKCSSAPNPAKQ